MLMKVTQVDIKSINVSLYFVEQQTIRDLVKMPPPPPRGLEQSPKSHTASEYESREPEVRRFQAGIVWNGERAYFFRKQGHLR